MARQERCRTGSLRARGARGGPSSRGDAGPRPDAELLPAFVDDLTRVAGRRCDLAALAEASRDASGALALDRVHAYLGDAGLLPAGSLSPEAFARLWAVYRAGIHALDRYAPRSLPASVGRLVQIDAGDEPGHELRATWAELCAGGHEVLTLPGDHYTLLQAPHRDALIAALRRHLGRG